MVSLEDNEDMSKLQKWIDNFPVENFDELCAVNNLIKNSMEHQACLVNYIFLQEKF